MRDHYDFSKMKGRKNPYATGAKDKDANELRGKLQAIPNFLPSPAEVAFCEEGVKVTLALSKKSVEFFKAEASRHHTQYQRMIRRLLDAYVDAQPQSGHSPYGKVGKMGRHLLMVVFDRFLDRLHNSILNKRWIVSRLASYWVTQITV